MFRSATYIPNAGYIKENPVRTWMGAKNPGDVAETCCDSTGGFLDQLYHGIFVIMMSEVCSVGCHLYEFGHPLAFVTDELTRLGGLSIGC